MKKQDLVNMIQDPQNNFSDNLIQEATAKLVDYGDELSDNDLADFDRYLEKLSDDKAASGMAKMEMAQQLEDFVEDLDAINERHADGVINALYDGAKQLKSVSEPQDF
ncbi:MAG: hypothetical protein PVJ09_02995 [Candidatus Woesebacteria bacterium]|jgi:hypothetical protein